MNTDEATGPGGLPVLYSIKRHGVTITNCDDEPVQTPGCIQPHGLLLVLRVADLEVLQASENSAALLGAGPEALLGRRAAEVLGDEAAGRLRGLLDAEPLERNPLYAFSFTPPASPAPLDVTVHTVGGFALVELEPVEASRCPSRLDYYLLVRRATARLQAAPTVAAFCQAAAEEVRAATCLDRVMIYRFLDDGAGEVVAEARREDLHPWLGLRYPAEDIPKPAREIFKRIGVRPLPDASASPAEMVPLANPDTGRPLDMTHCALRGASVMYTEYLQNMGVAASLTMPLLRDGELWGLVACHHYTPLPLPYPVRTAAECLAQAASLQLKNAEDREHEKYRERMDAAHHALLSRAALEGGLAAMASIPAVSAIPAIRATAEGSPTLLDALDAGGAALYHEDRWWTVGRTPGVAQLEELAGWLRTQPEMSSAVRPVFATDSLGARFPPAARYADAASGVLAIPVSRGERDLIAWFRPEQVQTFNWAGNPYEKPTKVGPHGPRLTPRGSFDIWQEQVRGRSLPWEPAELEAALKLRYLVMDLVVSRAEQLARLNADLARTNEELDAFAYVASHDLKEPLRGIHKHAYYLMEDAKAGRALDEKARERLEGLLRLTLRMDALLDALLHFSRVGRTAPEYEQEPLGPIVREAVEMLGARVEESGAEIVVPREMPSMPCDRVRVREIFSNLISNAIKYNDKDRKRVEIGWIEPGDPGSLTPPFLDPHDPEAVPEAARGCRVFYVKDNGIGIDRRHHADVFRMFRRLHPRDAFGGGTGAGLAIVRKMVEQHGGTIWIESAPGEGTAFLFTLAGPEEGDP